jgi:hypothetical protein
MQSFIRHKWIAWRKFKPGNWQCSRFWVQLPAPQKQKKRDRSGLSAATGYHLMSWAVLENPTRYICQWALSTTPTLTSLSYNLLESWGGCFLRLCSWKGQLKSKKWLSGWLGIKSVFSFFSSFFLVYWMKINDLLEKSRLSKIKRLFKDERSLTVWKRHLNILIFPCHTMISKYEKKSCPLQLLIDI